MTHALAVEAQETICRRCRCRWDFDERPTDDELCIIDEPASAPAPRPRARRSSSRSSFVAY